MDTLCPRSTSNGMSRKNKKGKNDEANSKNRHWHEDLKTETKKSILAVLIFIAAALFILSYLGKGGTVGGYVFKTLDWLLGKGYFFAPLSFVLVGFSLVFSAERKIMLATVLGGALFLLASLVNLEIIFGARTGGFIGHVIGSLFLNLFDFWASLVLALGMLLVSLLLMLDFPLFIKKREEDEEEKNIGLQQESSGNGIKEVLETINSGIHAALEKAKTSPAETTAASPAKTTIEENTQSSLPSVQQREENSLALRKLTKKLDYKKPPLELLQGDRGKPSSGDIKANANIIKRTLENFGIDVEMGEISVGPTVTQYTLRPAEGVKLSKITTLNNDLSLALAAHPLRIEAPIPGKSLVGVEVPNKSVATVGLRALLEHKIFQESAQPLLCALGRDVAGYPIFADLTRMPHLLISGATGTGKSVSVHALITSFLYRNPPEMLRFIIVDPKRVELSVYNDIPHLLTPVITDPKKTIQALRWATREMDRRYDLLSIHKVRDLVSYHAGLSKFGDQAELLPYIVIIIDELADLMAVFPREVESSIIRLAQMARAVGIHLIVSTQRPSVEVITGLIKANITSRIAFQVASQIDSRTILDMSGAEKLLGNGDMLFLAGDSAKPRRIQGAFVSEQEVKRVVDFLREEVGAPEHEEEILETKIEEETYLGENNSGGDDPLYEEAKEMIILAGKASASYLQRRLRVGYARAARLLDILESRGIIGPADGAKPRDVLIKNTDLADGDSNLV